MAMQFQFPTSFLLILLVSLCSAELQVVNNFREGNTVRLECRDGGLAQPNVMFWHNEVSNGNELRALTDPEVQIMAGGSGVGQITFIITRELEGIFYCGRSLVDHSTEGLELIAHPAPNISPSTERTFFAKEGTTAHVNCSILPGALRRQYYADWLNSTSLTIVARENGPRISSVDSRPRFSVDEETFSLSINSVQFSDSGSYQCVLGVQDPAPAGRLFTYTRTENYDLELIVYDTPFLVRTPRERIIALNNNSRQRQSVTFQCEARGEPLPQIQWYHKSESIEELDTGKYTVSMISRQTVTRDIVTSILTINKLNAVDSGEVKCVVEADDSGLPEELPSDSATTLLVIIGGVDDFDLLITKSSDIIFKIQLPATILVPVQLSIHYIDVNNPDLIVRRLTSSSYNNTSQITHFEPSVRVPSNDLPHVRVMIGLQHQGMQGPTKLSPIEYDLSKPTIFTAEEASVQKTAIISICVSVIIITLLLMITILIAVSYINKKGRIREIEKERDSYKNLLIMALSNNKQSIQEKASRELMRSIGTSTGGDNTDGDQVQDHNSLRSNIDQSLVECTVNTVIATIIGEITALSNVNE